MKALIRMYVLVCAFVFGMYENQVHIYNNFQDNPGHDNLSEKVCNEVLSSPDSSATKLWVKILNQMEVSPDNEVVLKDLRILCYKMVKVSEARFFLLVDQRDFFFQI